MSQGKIAISIIGFGAVAAVCFGTVRVTSQCPNKMGPLSMAETLLKDGPTGLRTLHDSDCSTTDKAYRPDIVNLNDRHALTNFIGNFMKKHL